MEKNLFSQSSTQKESMPWIITMTMLWIGAICLIYQANQNPDATHLWAILTSVLAFLFSVLVLNAAASPPVKVSEPNNHYSSETYFVSEKVSAWASFNNPQPQLVDFEPKTRFLIASRRLAKQTNWITGGSAVKLEGDTHAVKMKAHIFYSPNTVRCLRIVSEEGNVVYTLMGGQVVVPLAKPSAFPGYITSNA